MSERGSPKDDSSRRQWLDRVRAKHRITYFRAPLVKCSCEGWHKRVDAAAGIFSQRDMMLDAFNEHLAQMRAERRKYLEEQKAEKIARRRRGRGATT